MLYSYTLVALIVSFVAILLDGVITFLVIKTVTNCANIYQSSTCYSTLPIDIIICILIGLVAIFDLLQIFSIDKLRYFLTLEASPITEHFVLQRRARLLHLWTIPFQIGVLITYASKTYFDGMMSLGSVSLLLTPLLIYTSNLTKPASIHIIGLVIMIIICVADTVNFIYKRDSLYAQWCLLTIILFDICLIGIRIFIAMYKPEVITLIKKSKEDARWMFKSKENKNKNM